FKPNANLLSRDPNPNEPIDFRSQLGRPLRVRWEGDQSLLSSLALVSREFCLGLLGGGDVELTLTEQPSPWHTLTERDDPRSGPSTCGAAARQRRSESCPWGSARRHFVRRGRSSTCPLRNRCASCSWAAR